MTPSRHFMTKPSTRVVVFAFVLAGFGSISGLVRAQSRQAALVPKPVLLAIVSAEDERRWDGVLAALLSHSAAAVRSRSALAAGRIGNELSVPALVSLLQSDKDRSVRSFAAFALGEIESPKAIEALTSELVKGDAPRARIVEALGKIAAALPQTNEVQKKEIGKTILGVLTFEARRRSRPDSEVILRALTAALRARPEGAGPVVAEFLSYSDPSIRSDAGNTLARLRAADGNLELRKLLPTDPDPNVRANAARVLGATEDKDAFDGLLDRALNDPDSRVRVSAIRALASLRTKEPKVAKGLASIPCQRELLKSGNRIYHERDAECLELVTALGRVFQGTNDPGILGRLEHWLWDFHGSPPEPDVALVRISPRAYLARLGDEAAAKDRVQGALLADWRWGSSLAQALGEIAVLPDSADDKKQLAGKAESLLRSMLEYPRPKTNGNRADDAQEQYALPDVLRALAAFKPSDLSQVLQKHLSEPDVAVRTTAAELLGDVPGDSSNIEALSAALKSALQEKKSNDAALAILDALAKYKNSSANQAIMTGLDSRDYLVRRKAIESLKATGAGDFSNKLGAVGTRNTARDFERAISRIDKRVLAVVTTNKGRFTIELLPAEAPLNVDNFVQLAKHGYFNKIVFHRVVPNFVIQGGDPRGDGNGGPGYQIRCEINEVPYRRGAVGMALSGKDTGGSQWFVTHAPQPHLDGGYTVFGNVIAGMEIVDSIVRGDVIKSIVVTEKRAPKMQTAPVNILEN